MTNKLLTPDFASTAVTDPQLIDMLNKAAETQVEPGPDVPVDPPYKFRVAVNPESLLMCMGVETGPDQFISVFDLIGNHFRIMGEYQDFMQNHGALLAELDGIQETLRDLMNRANQVYKINPEWTVKQVFVKLIAGDLERR